MECIILPVGNHIPTIGIIATGILCCTLVLLNQNHPAMAQQQQPNGNSFEIDNMTFSHNMASVNGIKLHYVIGGHGPPVVLLHGWPETWYEWHKIMPALAKNYTVIAPDLRGLGGPYTYYQYPPISNISSFTMFRSYIRKITTI